MPLESNPDRGLLLLSAGGFVSGIASAWLSQGSDESMLPGIVFGVMLAICAYASGVADIRRSAGLVVTSFLAFLCANYAARAFQMAVPHVVPANEAWSLSTDEPASPIALFVGGCVGGATLFGGVLLFIARKRRGGEFMFRLFQGAILGGMLGVIGWALRSTAGAGIWHLLHGMGGTPLSELSPRQAFGGKVDYSETVRMYSLFVTWQTCMGVALAFMLRNFAREASR